MEIRVSTTEELTEADRRSVIEVCIAAHDNADFANLFTYIPSGGRHFLAYDGSDLVSHAVVTTRWLEPDGAGVLKTAYVDAVSTLPAAQHRGFAGATMRALGAGIGDYEIGGLQTDLRGFYEQFGWEFWRGPLAGRGDDSTLIPTPDQHGVMVLRLPHTPPLNFDRRMTIEKQPDRIWE